MADAAVFKSDIKPDWCPGCGDFGVLNSLQKACADLNLEPHQVMIVSGIGCSSNLPGFFNSYGLHTLHGRSLPVASGVKLGNSDLTVIATGGDGDGYGIGAGHFVHSMRRNLDITYIVMDNQIYGLTTGQASPTTERMIKTKSTPQGNLESQLNPIALALAGGASFVARGFSGEPTHLAELYKQAIRHKGFALVDVFSPCMTYNKNNTYTWFKERIYKLEDQRHDPKNFEAAMARSQEWGTQIPIGVFYQNERMTYEEGEPAMAHGAMSKLPFKPLDPSILLEFV
ncbi:MAG: 2-oxoacid ferredoxin oxidoreductase [Elusimicrobia bacterium RIFCSPLOWO2_01_FULL_59_12]|nr:MAG: 2-oxoacid ferredoxin oxidoreductase [Elusimicrobia bacterium RIFCSPLOWO2_01_FULL_59_12]